MSGLIGATPIVDTIKVKGDVAQSTLIALELHLKYLFNGFAECSVSRAVSLVYFGKFGRLSEYNVLIYL